ncbi:hypothetical protein SLEP1_g50875 [Rubroshorea leprosula]|nr:hypothetical protein SLEP1_g50875 [Rubroshorea leprosula]
MVKSFEQLEVLKIEECKEMQVVILIEELVEKEKTSQTMFPKLDRLELRYLPQLVRFCSNCNSFGEVYEAQGLSGSGSQVVAAAQSKLVEREVTQLVFPRVTYLKLSRLPNFKGFFPKIHITKWPLLKRMIVEQCDKVKTFASEFPSIEITDGDNQLERQTQDPMFWIGKDSFSCLEELKFQQNDNMKRINGLMHLWKQESDLKLIFYNLRSLEVLECIKLVNLVPSVVSFVNLQTLEISKCHGLENLVSYSTAKSLEQLERMSITDCDLVEEIVKCLEDNVKDGIVFSQLKSLQLRGLPKLSSFCTMRCDFEFPSLKEAIVIGCPQMKYFSMGKTITKELRNVQWTDDEEKRHWASDLDSTIQDLSLKRYPH